ncbi:hypothetical protein B0H14DRAFT_2268399, partial [Mycena olivaceomarginata]
MSSPSREDVVLSSSPISIRGGSPVRRRASLSRSESDISRSRHSPTLSRSLDPNDPQVRERQRTMDVDMAMQLSRARREIIPPVVEHEQPDSVFPVFSSHEQHELDIARGEPEEQIDNLVPIPTFVEMNHISAHDPSMLVHESQLHAAAPSSTFGGLPTYQPNASHS